MHVIYQGSVLNHIADELMEAKRIGKSVDHIELTANERHLFIEELKRLSVPPDDRNDTRLRDIACEAYEVLNEFRDTGACHWHGVNVKYNGWAG